MYSRTDFVCAVPVMTVMLKWTVLGRLKPGLHPLWGSVYIRWWLSNKAVEVSGFGIFGMSDGLFRIYLRMMGARVGRGAKIGRLVRIADFDMLEIHANAAVDDYAHLRAAEVRRGALRVAPVYLGPGSTVCTRAIVGPGGVVPQGATLGPYMSWRELDVTNPKTMAQMEEHRKIARMRQPQPGFGSQMLAWPIVFVCEVVAWIPWIFVFVADPLAGALSEHSRRGRPYRTALPVPRSRSCTTLLGTSRTGLVSLQVPTPLVQTNSRPRCLRLIAAPRRS